jgi:hypothetical protein
LAYSLAQESQNDPDLARIVEAWPRLPDHLRAEIMALVNTAKAMKAGSRNP